MRMRRSALAALVFVVRASASAQGPSADWRTIETAHFRVHFPAPFAAFARHTAESLESIHARVSPFVGAAPERPIEIVVGDPAADSNGSAAPFLDRPAIVVWASPPDASSGLGDFFDWPQMLAIHEDVHIAHLARPRRGPWGALAVLERLLPAPFGPLVLSSPRWLYEGYATLAEGALTGSGRPASSFRAMFLRALALDGKLPPYDDLNGGSGWLEDSVPYLVGSAYLEWLQSRAGPASLPELWRRMASGEGLDASFRGVFGDTPEALYGRFVEETVARAKEEARRLSDAGLVEGELALKLEGGTSSLQVSPDGSRLLARRDPAKRRSYLAVWDLSVSASGEDRAARWTLPRLDGFSPADPRWMPDGRRVLFSMRAPDAEGVLRRDLYLWDPAAGTTARVTRREDLGQADPAPGGLFAVAVRNRFGVSTLVRVELSTGAVSEIPVALRPTDAWIVWNEPRVSPDGLRVAALLHRDGRWRLVVLPVGGGAPVEVDLPGDAAGAPAWSADGAIVYAASDATGTWNLVAASVAGGAPRARTRVTGGAFAPAPAPDGQAVYFLDWTQHGVDVRRLAAGAAEPPAAAESPLARTRPATPAPILAGTVPADRPYSVRPSMTVRTLLNFSIGPDGDTVQIGADGSDVLDRFHWLAAASLGNTPGPRGGTAAAAWRGFPVTVSVQFFSALEVPGRQSLAPRPELDADRTGAWAQGTWGRRFSWGRVDLDAGTGVANVDPNSGGSFFRSLANTRARLAVRRTRGNWGGGLDLEAIGTVGETNGLGWTQAAGSGRLLGITPIGAFAAGARWGDTGGRPSRFDVFEIGGSPSTILPPGFDRNRIENPALPFAVQLGEKFEAYRAELEVSGAPVVAYGEWLRAWSAGSPRPDWIQAAGAELRLERLIPDAFSRIVSFRVGGAWIASTAPSLQGRSFHTVRGYADLIYRP